MLVVSTDWHLTSDVCKMRCIKYAASAPVYPSSDSSSALGCRRTLQCNSYVSQVAHRSAATATRCIHTIYGLRQISIPVISNHYVTWIFTYSCIDSNYGMKVGPGPNGFINNFHFPVLLVYMYPTYLTGSISRHKIATRILFGIQLPWP